MSLLDRRLFETEEILTSALKADPYHPESTFSASLLALAQTISSGRLGAVIVRMDASLLSGKCGFLLTDRTSISFACLYMGVVLNSSPPIISTNRVALLLALRIVRCYKRFDVTLMRVQAFTVAFFLITTTLCAACKSPDREVQH